MILYTGLKQGQGKENTEVSLESFRTGQFEQCKVAAPKNSIKNKMA